MKQVRILRAAAAKPSAGASPKWDTSRGSVPLPASFDMKRIATRREDIVRRAVVEPGESLPPALYAHFASRVCHAAGLEHHSTTGVMSRDALNEAEADEFEFDDADAKSVNDYLTLRLNTPGWDYQ